MKNNRELLAAVAVVVSFLSLTLTYTLILPPFEGFDENAHYSYISLLADRGQAPDFRTTPLDVASSDTADHLPRPYSSVPPFERNGGKTYGDFFRRTPDAERRAIVCRFWQPLRSPTNYAPRENSYNWIGQHPPLYYALMTLPYRCARSASPGGRLLVLRVCSAILACVESRVLVEVAATVRIGRGPEDDPHGRHGSALFPLLLVRPRTPGQRFAAWLC